MGFFCSGSPLASAIKKGDFAVAAALLELGADWERASKLVRRNKCKTLVALPRRPTVGMMGVEGIRRRSVK